MADAELVGPTSHIFVSQRQRLHYVDWGNPDAPLLVLVHGGRDQCRSWDWVARALRHDWHVIAPDLRGHGDSAWSTDGNYGATAHLADLSQLLHQLTPGPVTLIAHSLGAAVALRYAGLFPEKVRKLVSIEGSGAIPPVFAARAARPFAEKWRGWIEERREASARSPHRYATLENALARMREANASLSEEQIHHLTINAVSRNEDGSFSWKFDPYVRLGPPLDIAEADRKALWGRITCPVLLAWGRRSWGTDPAEDGTAALFHDARTVSFDAGHWPHHDQLDAFVAAVRAFL